MAEKDLRPITVKLNADKDLTEYAVSRGFRDIIATCDAICKLRDPDAMTYEIFANKVKRQTNYLIGCISKMKRLERKEQAAEEKVAKQTKEPK